MAGNIIDSEITELKNEIPKLRSIADDYLFSAVCAKFFYYDGAYSYSEFKDSFVDGALDGGIDLILVDDSESQPVFVLIQGKNHQALQNKQDVVDIFTKISQTISNFKTGNISGYNDRLRRIYKEKYDLVVDQNPKIRLVLFISAVLDDSRISDIQEHLNRIESLVDYELEIYDGRLIESQIQEVKNPAFYVNSGAIEWEKADGKLKYNDDGILVNIFANSLRDMYDKYKDQGLFAQNFRHYIRNKRIDESVNKSLEKKRDQFWYLNNGIIIGCTDWYEKDNKIVLENFSIINGCQTTTLIGKYNKSNQGQNFKIPCKIIKSVNHSDTFISEIAEASNSQKPILDRDLKANFKEQIKLRNELAAASPEIYLEIKRGQESPSKKRKEPWQFVKNDELGQFYLSFIFQQPGTARSNKAKIFSDIDTYNKLFKRHHDKSLIIDLLKLHQMYGEFKNEKSGSGSPDEENVLLSSDKVILGLVGFILKIKRNLIDIKTYLSPDQWADQISNDDLSGPFLNFDTPSFDKKVYGLFSYLNHHLLTVYDNNKIDEKSVSNFFKTDAKYREKILRYITRSVYNNDFERDQFEEKYLSIFL